MLATLAAVCAIKHPRSLAPPDLLNRVAASNAATLSDHAPKATSKGGLRIVPTDFGADPTGRADSHAALTTAIGACLNQSALSPNGNFPGDTSFGNGHAIRDMGGCNIDLEGGEYRISAPLVLPEYNANMQFGRGSLVAAPGFKGDFLFVIGVKGSCQVPQGSCNIDINFPELFLDGAHLASGMQINNVMGVTIGPGGYFLNFTQYGLQINAGHEVMMDRCWLGETNFDFDHEKFGRAPNATAIQINGNDHYILNTIVFSSKVGVEVNGAADYVSGVHVWFPVNHAVHYADTMAFHVTEGGNRFSGCYIDGGRAVFEPSALSRNVWTNGFECCQRGAPAAGTAASGILLIGDKAGPGLQIMNNEFAGGSIYHRSSAALRTAAPLTVEAAALAGASGDAVAVEGVRIAHNSMQSGAVGTQATLALTQTQATTWRFDFCAKLVFAQIATVRVHVVAQKGFPTAVARPPEGCVVTVETAEEMSGTITVDVDSSAPSDEFA